MTKLSQRLVSVGPLDNDTYRRLTKVARNNGHDTAEEFVDQLVRDVLAEVEGDHVWVAVAVARVNHDFAVGKWGEDASVMFDDVLGRALDAER